MNLQDVIMIIVLGFLAFYFFWWPDLKRTRSLKSKAKELNFPFYTKGDDSLLDKLKYFYLFSISNRHKIKNMLHQGNDELDIAFFDYSFVIGGGFNDGKPGTGATYATSAVYFCSTKLDLPQFALEPEKKHQIEDLQDIDFIDYPKFSDKYLLRGNPEESIRKLFNKELIKFFESISELELSVEGGGDQIIIYNQKRIDPKELNKFMDKGMEVFYNLTNALNLH
ncbi:MAG: hypothetical protein ACJZ70_12385 [Limisphaerales bacterium]